MRLGLLTELDTTALTMYCRSYQRWVYAERMITKEGAVQVAESGYQQQRAWVGIATAEFNKLKTMLSEFGLTPSARSRIELPAQEAEEDEFAALYESSEIVARKRKAG